MVELKLIRKGTELLILCLDSIFPAENRMSFVCWKCRPCRSSYS